MELEFNKINERLDKMAAAFNDLKQHVIPLEKKRYFVAPHASDETDQIDTAHALALSVLTNVTKEAQSNRNSYAKIEHCCEALNPILSKFDLSVKQIPSYNEYGEDILITRLSHKSGQWYESMLLLRLDKSNTQSMNQTVGSSITYMRRYALLAILGVGQTDDPVDTDK